MTGRYIDPTAQDKEAFILEYIEQRKDTYTKRLPRYNGKGRGRATTGTISVRASLRKNAIRKWNYRVRRAMKDKQELN